MAEQTLLDYRPTHERGDRYRERRWLAWPAWAHRIVAPVPVPRELDVLQRAILGVLRASTLTANEIAPLLGVAPELVAHVEHDLRCAGKLDAQRAVTEHGRASLQADSDADARLVPVWVFSDPWSKRLWPFLADSLQRAELVPGERFPRLVKGEHSSKVWFEVHPERKPSRLEPRAILSAAEQHGQRQRWWNYPAADEPDFAPVDAFINRIAVIEPEPVRVHLLTYLYTSEQTSDWNVCEPFGRGTSSALRDAVREHAVAGSGLERLLIDLLQANGQQSYEEYCKVERALEQAGRAEVFERLGQAIDEHPELSKHLIDAIVARETASRLDGSAGERRRRAAMVDCRTSLELLFATLAHEWPLEGVDEILPVDRDTRTSLLTRLAQQCGFETLPDSLTRVDRDSVRSVANYRNAWRLRALLVATVLRASRDAAHPLRRAAQQEPALLTRIEEMLVAAGGAAHGDMTTVGPTDVVRHVELTITAVELLLVPPR